MKGRAIGWLPEERSWIAARAEWPRRDLHRAFVGFWLRPEVSYEAFRNFCKREGIVTGRTGCFARGTVPPNKGKPMPPEVRAKVAATMFRKGSRSGRAEQLYQPVGAERVSKDGYTERKINDGLPMQARWRAVHLIRWEAENGPLPEGHALKCLDGDRLNTDPSNWVCIPRAMLPRLNGRFGRQYDAAEPEVKPVIMAITKLEHAAREARRAS